MTTSKHRTERTAESLQFEAVVKEAVRATSEPRLPPVDLCLPDPLSSWTAQMLPNAVARTMNFVKVGSELLNILQGPVLGSDYLDVVDPAFQGEAFDSAFLMLSRPCGLWQVTPVTLSDGSACKIEYTGFPVYDFDRHCGLVLFMVRHEIRQPNMIVRVHHSSDYAWLDLRTHTGS